MRASLRMALALALLTGSAGAQGEGDDPASVAARGAFSDGNAEFKLGHWRAAAAAWEHGYQLKPDPGFLYNIAQAYRQADLPDKALFFYRGYLRDAPQAANRAQVEERVAQLERVLVERAAAGTPAAGAAEGAAAATVATAAPAPRARRIDVEAGVGLALWTAGVPSGTSPSLMVSGGAGYTPWRRGRLELRVGGLASYTMLREASATDHFIGLHAVARLRVRLVRRRLFADGEASVGAQIVSGLAAGSALLAAHAAGGTTAAFALQPALALELRATDLISLRTGAALAYSPLAMLASPSLVRVELGLTALLRF